MLNVINKIKLTPKEKKFDFLENRSSARNAVVTKELIKSSDAFVKNEMPFSLGKNLSQIKKFDNKMYLLDLSGNLYLLEGSERKICEGYKFSNDFKMGYVDYQDKTATIIFSQKSSVLLIGGLPSLLPFTGLDYVYAFGRIFYYDKNVLYFTKAYDFFGEPEGAVNIEDVAGKFRKLYVIHDDLYVICSKRIYKIPRFSSVNDITLNVMQLVVKDIFNNAVFGIGDKVYYFEDYKLCCFDGKTIKKYDTLLNDKEYVLYLTSTGEIDGVINILVGYHATNTDYVYQYDTTNNTQCFIEIKGKFMPWYSACISPNGELMTLSSDATVDLTYTSEYTDFSDENVKLAYSVSGYSSHNISIDLESEFGKKTIFFNKGYNRVFCNFKFNLLKMKVGVTANNFQLKNLKIQYTTTD